MSDSNSLPSTPADQSASPDYVGLVRFLVTPFLENPDSLKVDCEVSPRSGRVLIRLAFEGEDKGRVFGRGGRNIQAIRTVLQAIAQTKGCSAHLDIFGSQPTSRHNGSERNHGSEEKPSSSKAPPRRVPRPQR